LRVQVLFPSHHKSILTSQAATNPLFLRVLLKALHWSALRGFDVWRVFNDWAQAEVHQMHKQHVQEDSDTNAFLKWK
jgi:hypothetical protein